MKFLCAQFIYYVSHHLLHKNLALLVCRALRPQSISWWHSPLASPSSQRSAQCTGAPFSFMACPVYFCITCMSITNTSHVGSRALSDMPYNGAHDIMHAGRQAVKRSVLTQIT